MPPRMHRYLGLVVLVGLACTTSLAQAQAAPGVLDPSFSADGWRLVRSDGDRYAHNVVIDGRGRIVASGRDGSHFGLFRFLDDGTTDRRFGGGDGRVEIEPPGAYGSVAGQVALQPDGRMVVGFAAFSTSGDYTGVVRVMPDGGLDRSFGRDGIRRVPALQDAGSGVIVQPDGRILLPGRAAIIRLLEDGRRDRSFSAPQSGLQSLRSAALAPDGSLVIFSAPRAGTFIDWQVQRLLPDGSLDRTFGVDGLVSDLWHRSASASEVFVQRDGRILLVGAVMGPSSIVVPDLLAMIRLMPDGSLDPSFGGDGRRAPPAVEGFRVQAAVADGQLYVGMHRQDHNRYARFHLDDGRLDRRFGESGVVDVAPIAVSQMRAIVVDTLGRLVSVGYGQDDATPPGRLRLFLSRLLPT